MAPEEGSERKKKKHADKEKKSSKKRAATDNDQAATSSAGKRIKLTHVEKEDDWTPVIASASGFSLPSGLNYHAYRDAKRKELLLHSPDHPRMDYIARQHQEGGIQNHLKHYILIYDPDKQEAQVVEAIDMTVRSRFRAEAEQVNKETLQNESLSRMHQLGLEFGTKKAKKRIESKMQNAIRTIKDPAALAADPEAMKKAIKADPAAAAVLESMAEAAANAPTKEAMQAAIDQGMPRPKFNPEATKKEAQIPLADIYPISDIIGDEVIKQLKVAPWFDAIEDGEAVETPSRFISNRLQDIILDEQEDAVFKVRILKWMLITLKLFNACKKVKGMMKLPKPRELKEAIGEDTALVDAVKNKFAPAGGEMRKWDIDYLITHLLVYSLIVDDFKTDYHDLRLDLDLEPQAMNNYFQQVGVRVKKMSEGLRAKKQLTVAEAAIHKVAELTLPLQFPTQRLQVQRRGRR